MYRTEVYFISKFLVELPIYIISPFISFAIPYYAIGLNAEVGRFFIGAGVMILVTNVAISFGNFKSVNLLLFDHFHLKGPKLYEMCRLFCILPDI